MQFSDAVLYVYILHVSCAAFNSMAAVLSIRVFNSFLFFFYLFIWYVYFFCHLNSMLIPIRWIPILVIFIVVPSQSQSLLIYIHVRYRFQLITWLAF